MTKDQELGLYQVPRPNILCLRNPSNLCCLNLLHYGQMHLRPSISALCVYSNVSIKEFTWKNHVKQIQKYKHSIIMGWYQMIRIIRKSKYCENLTNYVTWVLKNDKVKLSYNNFDWILILLVKKKYTMYCSWDLKHVEIANATRNSTCR